MQLGEELIQCRRVESEFTSELFAANVRREVRRDRDRRVFVLEIDGERELLRDIQRLELERVPGLAQRAIEITELAEDKAQVVPRTGEARVGIDRPAERVSRVLVPTELHQHESDPVPPDGARRLFGQRALIFLERLLELPPLQQEEGEIEASRQERLGDIERVPERGDGGLTAGFVRATHTKIVPRRAGSPGRSRRPARRTDRFGPAAGLMQADAALVPQLRRIGILADQSIVKPERGGKIALEQVNFRQRLEAQSVVLARLECQPVLGDRLLQIPFLPERQSEVVVRERTALDDLHGRAAGRDRTIPRPFSLLLSPFSPLTRSSARFA